MSTMIKKLKALGNKGVSTIEYGVLAVAIIAMVVAAMAAFTPALTTGFTALGNSVINAMGGQHS